MDATARQASPGLGREVPRPARFAVYRRRDTGPSVASHLWSPTVRQRHIQDGRPK